MLGLVSFQTFCSLCMFSLHFMDYLYFQHILSFLKFMRQNKAIQNHPLTSLFLSSHVYHGPDILSLHLITFYCKPAKSLCLRKNKYNRVFGVQAMIADCLDSFLIQIISELLLFSLEMAEHERKVELCSPIQQPSPIYD